jgi:pimeloyl-ACP methyl ester carboxylesterase
MGGILQPRARSYSAIFHWTFVLFTIVLCYSVGLRAAEADDLLASKFVRKNDGNRTLIVFVHGFRGDRISTWSNDNTGAYWPDLLTHDPAFDGADILTYGYNSGLWSTLSIDELAELMRSVLEDKQIASYRHVVFLSHSLGGLITRAYLLKNREIASHVSFLYFFSTPTSGSQLAAIGRLFFSSPTVAKMEPMQADGYLADQARAWLSAQFHFPVYCAYEKKFTDGVALVVEMQSALLLCTKPADPLDEDHYGVVKPKDDEATQYIDFRNAYRAQRAASNISTDPADQLAPIPQEHPNDALVQGELRPSDDATPPNGCDRLPQTREAAKVLIGNNGFAAIGFGRFTALRVGTCNVVEMEKTPNGVYFDADLWDQSLDRIVRMRRNEIEALNGEDYRTRQSRDLSSLIIHDSQGSELFYVRYLNATTLQVRGVFGCPGHTPVPVKDNQLVPGAFFSNNCFGTGPGGVGLNVQ